MCSAKSGQLGNHSGWKILIFSLIKEDFPDSFLIRAQNCRDTAVSLQNVWRTVRASKLWE